MRDKDHEEQLKNNQLPKVNESEAEKRFVRYYLNLSRQPALSADDQAQVDRAMEIALSGKVGFWLMLQANFNQLLAK